jgi:hypothetical protein
VYVSELARVVDEILQDADVPAHIVVELPKFGTMTIDGMAGGDTEKIILLLKAVLGIMHSELLVSLHQTVSPFAGVKA